MKRSATRRTKRNVAEKALTRPGNTGSITQHFMKKVLSLLLAYVFLQTQSWALSGGPVYAGSQKSIIGTYAGTLIGQLDLSNTTVGSNGLGVFVIGIPLNGVGSGVFGYFDSGITFFGTIIGIADPDKLTLNGIMQGEATQIIAENVGGTVATISFPSAIASGELVANLEAQTATNTSTAVSLNGFRLTGNATLGIRVIDQTTFNEGPTTTNSLSVDGFQQSNTVTSTVDLTTLTGATGK
jgi:hypothetical protein